MSEANMNNRFDFCANGKVVYKGTQFTEYEDVEDAEEVVNPYGDLWGTVSGAVAQIVNMHPFMQTLVRNMQYMGVGLMNSILMAIPIALTLNDQRWLAEEPWCLQAQGLLALERCWQLALQKCR